jgi:hypothetical protein
MSKNDEVPAPAPPRQKPLGALSKEWNRVRPELLAIPSARALFKIDTKDGNRGGDPSWGYILEEPRSNDTFFHNIVRFKGYAVAQGQYNLLGALIGVAKGTVGDFWDHATSEIDLVGEGIIPQGAGGHFDFERSGVFATPALPIVMSTYRIYLFAWGNGPLDTNFGPVGPTVRYGWFEARSGAVDVGSHL